MTYWRLHYHIVWSTRGRTPSIIAQREKVFCGVLSRKSGELGLKIHAVGVVNDHVHVVASIPPKISVADCVRQLKGASAYTINHTDGGDGQFKWQAGYAALTVSENSLDVVVRYATRQKEHHRDRTLNENYERIDVEE